MESPFDWEKRKVQPCKLIIWQPPPKKKTLLINKLVDFSKIFDKVFIGIVEKEYKLTPYQLQKL